ncbi:MAG: hypothetical protein H7343_14780 [Undibacterium sp.]|nr:hypothetical protein [Opitutaceae bacterium]
MKTFQILTLANDLRHYANLRHSFLAAGFDEERCAYTMLDNFDGNAHEPYGAYQRFKTAGRAKYFIFCHQDVLLSQGDGYDKLLAVLAALSRRDPTWAVAGNSGVNAGYELVSRIVDPLGTPAWLGDLPQAVMGLDENFIVVNGADGAAGIGWSPELAGFHFYGCDVCLNAALHGRKSYVIDFKLQHLGRGVLTADFWAIKARFQRHWEKRFHAAFIITPTKIPLVLTRHAWLRWLGALPVVQRRLLRPRALRLARRLNLARIPA